MCQNLKCALGARELAGGARVDFNGHAQGLGGGFEKAFGDVVVIRAAQIGHVQCDPARRGEGLKEFLKEFCIHGAEAGGAEFCVPDQKWAVGEIKRNGRAGFVHDQIKMAVAADAEFIADRAVEGLPQRNPAIFDAVVGVNVQIPVAAQCDVDEGMFRQLFEHMIEKADSCFDVGAACAVQIKGNTDLCFMGVAVDGGGAGVVVHGYVSLYNVKSLKSSS